MRKNTSEVIHLLKGQRDIKKNIDISLPVKWYLFKVAKNMIKIQVTDLFLRLALANVK